MSLVGTLGKIALGAIAAKGIGKMMGGNTGGGSPLGGLLGSVLGGSGGGSSAGNLLSGLMGGGSSGGGAGNMLSGLLGGGSQQGGGGLGAMLAGLTGQQGGGSQQAGGLGGLLNSLGGGSQQSGGGIGALLNQALAGTPADEIQATPDQEKEAEIMLRAMISAAKADGEIDAEEQRKITEHLGDVSPEEAELVRQEMQSQTNLDDLIKSVPAGMEQQVYFMSLLAIDLDTPAEAQYLDKLARGMNLSQQQCNAIHEKLGVPALYS